MPGGKQAADEDPKKLLVDSLEGLTYINPNILYDPTYQIISLKELSSNRCHVVCGGGSGHEPSHAGLVGSGILSAAVCGNIFASPNSQQVTKAFEKLENSKGILIVVKNYTGDVLNFGIAKERWIAQRNTEAIKMVIVGDDVSVGREQGKLAGRRGLAGTVLVYKIAGALAAQGAPLSHVHAVAQFVADHSATIGVGFNHCQIPGVQTNKHHDTLGMNEIEIGMGIHNEPGYKRQKISNLKHLISELMPVLTSTTDKDRSFLPFRNQDAPNAKESADQVILLINNLGSISELEMGAIVKLTGTWLLEKGFHVKRVISGTFMTSLNMSGFSISLVLLPPMNQEVVIEIEGEPSVSINDSMLLDLFDAPADCPGWKVGFAGEPSFSRVEKKETEAQPTSENTSKPTEEILTVNDPDLFVKAVQSACQALISAEPEITKYDTIAGDGDCGLTLKAGAEGILDAISQKKITGHNLVSDLLQISEVVNRDMGGTSGGLYSIYFNALAVGMGKTERGSKTIDAQAWANGLDYALNTLYKYTRARSPSRTLIDPLSAFVLTFTLTPSEFDKAVVAAREAAENTMYLDAQAGRASYVDRQKLQDSQVPDAGAWGVWKILEAVALLVK
ncbi:hypothetical protein PCANC_24963 [Puccinia coronata f. sp. avenae]|uniref:Dihydroxyacetone kinase n=1 Tax=Puccinia coronata f. sp. avenae TaxID=200324 RepID=A0A2N5S332_9BASI|nr:hypothetical protein PCANC_24963 [Puccinia coronata f. sp. avenae]